MRKKYFGYCLTFALFSLIPKLNGQVLNVDRENGQDTLNKRFCAAFDFNFSIDKQKGDFIDVNNRSELGLSVKKNMILIFLNSTELSLLGKSQIENNGYFQLRFRDNDKRKFFPDSYVQYQWNGILGLRQRYLVGSNLRVQWMEKIDKDLYTSIGVFYEDETWDPSFSTLDFSETLGRTQRQLIRLNTSLKFATKIGEKADLALVNFVQFPINSFFGKPRWFFNSNLNLAITKKWSTVISYEHNFDLYRPLPIDKFYYALTIGFRLIV